MTVELHSQNDTNKYYETYRDLFISPGWKQYVEEAKESLELLDLDSAKSWDDFITIRTKRRMLQTIVDFEAKIKEAERYILETNLEVYDDSL